MYEKENNMITAVSLNPSIDRTLRIDSLNAGGLNRVTEHSDAAAGKGVNVALAASVLGEAAECIGFMYEEGSTKFKRRLSDAGVSYDFVMCEGAVRVNTKVLDASKGEITEFNMSGSAVSAEQLEQMTGMVREHAQSTDFLVLSGSMPAGCPVDYYRTLAKECVNTNTKVILDADGDRFRAGLEAGPFLIKPNRYELELLTGHILSSTTEVLDAALACVYRGVKVVVVSLGAEGAIITDGKEGWYAKAKRVEIRSTVAAGDTMIAGLAAGFAQAYDLQNALRLGVAAATVRCMTDPEKMIDAELIKEIYPQIIMEKLM